jgi:hypothetical protein
VKAVMATSAELGPWKPHDVAVGLAILGSHKASVRAEKVKMLLSSGAPLPGEMKWEDVDKRHVRLLQWANGVYMTTAELVTLYLGITPADVIFDNVEKAEVGKPCYMVAIDRSINSVVIAVRGTASSQDVLTDMAAQPSTEHPWGSGLVHPGMMFAANMTFKNVVPLLEETFAKEEFAGFDLCIAGHSLGAGTSTLLSLLLFPTYPQLCCSAWATPCVVSEDFMDADRPWASANISSFVFQDDIVTRFSTGSIDHIRMDVENFPWGDVVKDKVLQNKMVKSTMAGGAAASAAAGKAMKASAAKVGNSLAFMRRSKSGSKGDVTEEAAGGEDGTQAEAADNAALAEAEAKGEAQEAASTEAAPAEGQQAAEEAEVGGEGVPATEMDPEEAQKAAKQPMVPMGKNVYHIDVLGGKTHLMLKPAMFCAEIQLSAHMLKDHLLTSYMSGVTVLSGHTYPPEKVKRDGSLVEDYASRKGGMLGKQMVKRYYRLESNRLQVYTKEDCRKMEKEWVFPEDFEHCEVEGNEAALTLKNLPGDKAGTKEKDFDLVFEDACVRQQWSTALANRDLSQE